MKTVTRENISLLARQTRTSTDSELEHNSGLINMDTMNEMLFEAYLNRYAFTNIKYNDFLEAAKEYPLLQSCLYFSTGPYPMVLKYKNIIKEYVHPDYTSLGMNQTINYFIDLINNIQEIEKSEGQYKAADASIDFAPVPQRVFILKYILKHKRKLSPLEKYNLVVQTRCHTEYNFESIDTLVTKYAKRVQLLDKNILELIRDLGDCQPKSLELYNKTQDLHYITFKVYRGMTPKSTDANKALSWTIFQPVALKFANRFMAGGDATIATAQVNLTDILAYISENNESEVLIKVPKTLYNIRHL